MPLASMTVAPNADVVANHLRTHLPVVSGSTPRVEVLPHGVGIVVSYAGLRAEGGLLAATPATGVEAAEEVAARLRAHLPEGWAEDVTSRSADAHTFALVYVPAGPLLARSPVFRHSSSSPRSPSGSERGREPGTRKRPEPLRGDSGR
ncbi:MAG TPA: hypothetical protein VD962_08095 [Rubricoccaceae bacterium]|nr:hypothetical protein [Rubricoccaceae bacterium]